ncbi:MAG: hypothetical protein JKY28_05365 [Sulfurimonas sp.]|nr:hypothetical protein [Sulfurimonas sp.]PHQ90117.1 MAG: hypothetical protein COB42_05740 [Sulfurimonas sp.]
MLKVKMTQKQMKELLGVSQSTFQRWFSDEKNEKHNLALLLSTISFKDAKKIIEETNANKST